MIDYQFYKNVYMGDTVPEDAFSGMVSRAMAALDRFRRIYRVENGGQDGESMALCAMAECIYRADLRREGVAAASAGNVSVRYEDAGRPALLGELYERASLYLDIYRGRGNG